MQGVRCTAVLKSYYWFSIGRGFNSVHTHVWSVYWWQQDDFFLLPLLVFFMRFLCAYNASFFYALFRSFYFAFTQVSRWLSISKVLLVKTSRGAQRKWFPSVRAQECWTLNSKLTSLGFTAWKWVNRDAEFTKRILLKLKLKKFSKNQKNRTYIEVEN